MNSASFHGFTGFKIIEKGLNDLQQSIVSEESLLLLIARRRLNRVGIMLKPTPNLRISPEHHLYMFLCTSYGDEVAYSKYNSLLRTLNSFCQAMEMNTTNIN